MIDISQALRKAQKLDFSDWRFLVLLSLGGFLLGLSTTFLEVGATGLFIFENTFHAIGIDFLAVAICSVFVGSVTVKLDRRHGYGGVPLTVFLTLVLFGFIKSLKLYPNSDIPANILFIYKYLMPVMVTMSFWSISGRFIALKLSSLKYIGVLSSNLLGIFSGGMILSHDKWLPDQILSGAFAGFLCLTAVMKILVYLLPQPTETFIRKTGGVQDSSEQKMIDCILMLAFTYTTCRMLGDYLLYQNLTAQNVLRVLSDIWTICGAVGFFALLVLSQTRFLYTTLWGLMLLGLGFFFLAEGAFLEVSWLLYAGFVIAWICGFLYWIPYLSLLPRPLTLGEGMRLRKKRQMMTEPLGVVLAGAFILTVPKSFLALLLGAFSLTLMLLMGLSFLLYSRLLLHLCKRRMWCGSPLMLVSDKLIRKVKEGASADNLDEVIYFLRIMEVAHFSGFLEQLLKTLTHALPSARIFALDKLDNLGFNKARINQAVLRVFETDKDVRVRSRALAFLIRNEGEYNPQAVYRKYGMYLDDKELSSGAILGFLQAGGEWALLAMDGLQKMACSHHVKDNLSALEIIDRVPQKGLVRLVAPLLKSSSEEVVRAALLTAGRIGHVQNLSFVFQSLDNPKLKEEALQALSWYGKKVFPPLEKMLSNPNISIQRRKTLISFLGFLPSGEGKQILMRSLYLPDIKLRKEVLKAILNSKITWVSRKRKRILTKGIEQDITWWHILTKNIQLCRQAPVPALGDSFSFLRRSFNEMRQDLRELILGQLILLKSDVLVAKAVAILQEGASQKLVSAAGILQDLFPASFYRLLKPILLAPLTTSEEEKGIPMDVTEAKHFLEQLIVAPSFPADRWMIASALYGLQKIDDKNCERVLDAAFSNISTVVLEAAVDMLTHVEPNKKNQEAYLNRQLHQVPKKFNLEFYLSQRRKNDYV